MGVKLVSASAGSVEIVAPATASNYTATMPARTGTVMMDGPTFSAYLGSAQTPTSGVFTKVLFDTELWDTNSNFSSSRFTPTVAGYYQVNSTVNYSPNTNACLVSIYKNGTEYKRGSQAHISSTFSNGTSVSGLVYCNGSTDYIEVYIYLAVATALSSSQALSYFDAAMIRSA